MKLEIKLKDPQYCDGCRCLINTEEEQEALKRTNSNTDIYIYSIIVSGIRSY